MDPVHRRVRMDVEKDGGVHREGLGSGTGRVAMTAGAILFFAVAMETSIAMIVLARVLKRAANRWANIAAGIFHTGLVAWSLLGQAPTPFYAFFAAVEIALTLFIVVYAWTWKRQPASTARVLAGESAA